MMKGIKTSILLITLGLVVCCLIGLPNLYDKFMIARFVAAAIGLAIVFLSALVGKKHWVVPNTPIFYIYLLFLFLCGCSDRHLLRGTLSVFLRKSPKEP